LHAGAGNHYWLVYFRMVWVHWFRIVTANNS
jgi:hypothetical protein